MKIALPIILIAVTAALMVVAIYGSSGPGPGRIGIATGSAVYGLTPSASTPQQALTNLLSEVQRRNWDRAFGDLSKTSATDKESFIQDWIGSNGSLRAFSNLEGFDPRPLHITNDDAQLRVRLHY
jgi:hypothetical protein